MSDEIDRIAVLAWSAFAGFQIGTAIPDGLKWAFDTWRNRARCKDCDHCRLIKGETRNGWQLVIPEQLCWQNGTVRTYFNWTGLRLKTTREDQPAMAYGFNVPFDRYAAENRSILQYRRFSLISDKVNATLFKIVYRNSQWRPLCLQNFGNRSIAVAFRRFVGDTRTSTCRIVIGDAFARRQPSWFDIQAPTETASLITVYCDNNVRRHRLMVLFQDQLPTHQFDVDMGEDFVAWRFEFHLTAYEIGRPTGEGQQKPFPAVSWETISIPGGVRNTVSKYILDDEVVLMVLYDSTNPEATENHLCVTFDSEERWRVETYPEWLASVQKTLVGARLMDAVHSLNKLRNVGRGSGSFSPLEDLALLNLRVNDGVVFYGSSHLTGVLRRWCKPPPLKFLAAASLVRANPDLSRDQLKDAIGFDVFDDVPDGKGEEDTPIIYW